MSVRRTILLALALLLAVSVTLVAPRTVDAVKPVKPPKVDFELTILHNNDGESRLREAFVPLPAIPPSTTSPGPDLTKPYAGVARFKTLVDILKSEATTGTPAASGAKRGVVMLSSGDNYLAGAEFAASLDNGVPFYDSVALSHIGYDGIAIGNHEFDFGPDVLADFIEGFSPPVPFLSANLDLSGEPELQALEDAGVIAKSTIVNERDELIGIIGATTPQLPNISSPRNVIVEDVAPAVQAEADRLTEMGVDKIILISHLQNIAEDQALAPLLSGIDVMIAGGGDELLANAWNPLSPGDTPSQVVGAYPLTATDADGASVPIITTAGQYKYVGRLVVQFDNAGEVIDVDEQRSGPVRVIGFDDGLPATTDHIVAPDPAVQAQAVDPVNAFVAGLASNVLAQSEVALDGTRPTIRLRETNLGNLTADSLLWQAQQSAAEFGVDSPQIALQNSGGIRNETLIPAGPISELHTFQILAFANFVSVMEDVPATRLKDLLETSISALPGNNGRFGHWAGLRFTFDVTEPGRVINSTTCAVSAPGERVQTIVVGGETIYDASLADPWVVDETTWTVDMTSNDFTFRENAAGFGGDCYDFGDAVPFTTVGLTYQQALVNYLVAPDGLNGLISAEQYPPVPPQTRIIPV
jgi:2',3'-cyclic-nucleotide 2'-phosphodiesterase (5'-nucleotidase family)